MENVFVLIVIFILLSIAFIIAVAYYRAGQVEKNLEFKEIAIIKKSQILSFLPELQCSDNNNIDPDCYDIYKIESFREHLQDNPLYYSGLLGNVIIKVSEFDPSPSENEWKREWIIYDNPKADTSSEDYAGVRAVHFPVLLKDPRRDEGHFGVVYLGVYE